MNVKRWKTSWLIIAFSTVSLILAGRAAAAPADTPATPVIGAPVAVESPDLAPSWSGADLLRSPLSPDYAGCGGVNAPVVNADYEQQVVELTNLERYYYANLPPLKRTGTLDDAARYHSTDMGQDNYFDHDSHDRDGGGNLVFSCGWATRVQSYYGTYASLAENIAAGQTTPAAVMLAWMNSTGHKNNIMSTSVREIGVGYFCCGGTYTRYWGQNFGRKSNVYPLVINRESGTTTSTSVNLYLYGSWTEMRLRNDSDAWGSWQSFGNNVAWTLPSALGTHTVSAEMRTGGTTVSASDTIDLVSGSPTTTPTTVGTGTPPGPTATKTPTKTPTPGPSGTPTKTKTPVNTPTKTNTPTSAPSNTPTKTSTPTTAPSNTPTKTNTPTAGPSNTATKTNTPTTAPSTSTATATAMPTATSSGSAPVHQQTVTGGSTASSTVTSGSLAAGSSGDIYLAAISDKPSVAVTSVSGLGMTWTLVKAQCAGRGNTRTEVWAAQGAGAAGPVVATFSSAPSNAVIAVSRYSGSSGIGSVVSANTLGVNGACTGGTDSNSYSVNLTTTVDNAVVYGAAALRNRTHTPGSGYSERAERLQGSGGDAATVAVEDKGVGSAGTVVVNGSFSGTVDWAVVAVEVKP